MSGSLQTLRYRFTGRIQEQNGNCDNYVSGNLNGHHVQRRPDMFLSNVKSRLICVCVCVCVCARARALVRGGCDRVMHLQENLSKDEMGAQSKEI
jgi:hypothetical protein